MNDGHSDNNSERMLFRSGETATIAPKTCSGGSKKSIDEDNGTCETKRRDGEAAAEKTNEVSLLFLYCFVHYPGA